MQYRMFETFNVTANRPTDRPRVGMHLWAAFCYAGEEKPNNRKNNVISYSGSLNI